MDPRRPRFSPLVALALLTGLSLAAGAAITWESQGTLEAHAQSPPVVFEAGENADNPRWFHSFEVSDDNTSLTAEIKPRAGAGAHVEDVVRLSNGNDDAREVNLTGSSVDNENIETFRWTITDGADKTVATLDHTHADPSAGFTLPAHETYRFDITIETQPGAGKHNAGVSFTLGLEVT